MVDKTRIAIVGYGNIGRGVHIAVERAPDMRLAGIVTRNPQRVLESGIDSALIYAYRNQPGWEAMNADVAILCGGSKNDLPKQGPAVAQAFNTVDSFDTHADIPEYFAKVDTAARAGGHLSVISAGWDPGTFSMERVLAEAFIPESTAQATYGLTGSGGLSMGHSDAIRQIPGVKDARQYTHAKPGAIDAMRRGKAEDLTPADKMWRDCVVVLENDSLDERNRVAKEIITMPAYFKPYHTKVQFVTQEVLDRNHSGMPHDGLVIAAGTTGQGNEVSIEYKFQQESNPEATANILVACARAVHRLHDAGSVGAITMLDIPPAMYSLSSRDELLKDFM